MNAAGELPGFAVIAAALRRTTERLACELARPAAEPPDWSAFEWDVARAVSAMQGITVLLAHGLRWRGPAGWQDFLETQRWQSLQRDAQIDSLITRLDEVLRHAGIGAVGLKGAALRRLDLYRAGERPMGDVDVLVAAQDFSRATRAFEALDFVAGYESRRHRVFWPRQQSHTTYCGEHPHNPLKIELHQAIAEPLPVRFVDITPSLLEGERHAGLNSYPSSVELLRHLLLHAAGNMRAHALRQVQLNDIARLSQRIDDGDWRRLRDTPASRGGAWWMWPALALVERYYPGQLPAGATSLRDCTPPVLRRSLKNASLTDVSWSNLRISAFPGMCWSRSVLDVLRFARSRVMPPAVALAELDLAKAAQPEMMRQPWYGISHPRRIARWLFTRPPRVQTMVSLRAAMRHGDAQH